MKNHLSFCIILFLITSGCVSVKLASDKPTKASDLTFHSPGKPFLKIDSPNSDTAWVSESQGNTISYLSECQLNNEMNLDQIESDSLSIINELQILDSKKIEYNQREAKLTLAQGKVDGVMIKVQLLIFKKNNCNFVLSYIGVEKNFEKEIQFFDQFKQSFAVK